MKYEDLEQTIQDTKEQISKFELTVEILKITLKAFELELEKLPKPKKQVAS